MHKREIWRLNGKKAAMIGRQMMSDKLFVIKVERKHWIYWKEIILQYKMMSAVITEKRKLNVMKICLKKWKKQYEMELTKKAIQDNVNEEKADKYHELLIMKRAIILWKQQTVNAKKEKIKARTWRKVEVWLAELRANR